MSYADLLNQYANKMSEVRGHAEEVSQSIAATKAAGAKELYDRAREHLTTAGEASAAASGAYMAGRKLYKKFQASRAAKAKAGEDDPEAGAEAEGAEGAEGAQGASSGGRAVGQGTSEGAGSGAEGGAGAEAGASGASGASGGATGEAGGGEVDDLAAQRGAIDQATKGEFQESAKSPTGDLGRNVESAETGEAGGGEAGGGEAPARASGAGEEASAEGPTLEGAPAEAVEATAGDTVSAANVGQQVGTNVAKSAIKTAAKSSGEALGEETGAAIGEGLASQALDFLGPVGLGIGAITGLVDLFEGVFGKKPKPASQEATPIETEGGGLDVKGLTATDSPATATLV